jgi:hypothetical protein
MRTLDVWHLFYIPLLPVGLWRRWHCAVCGGNPHVSPKTSRTYKWLGLAVLVVLSFFGWALIAEGKLSEEDSEGKAILLAMAVAAPIGAILTLVHLLRTPPDIPLKKLLAEIPPASETLCPFCNMPLVLSAEWKCSGCGVERSALPVG